MRTSDKLPLTERPDLILLDWQGTDHWIYNGRSRDCRLCYGRTRLLDDNRRPCHKVCAEGEIEARRRADRNAYPA